MNPTCTQLTTLLGINPDLNQAIGIILREGNGSIQKIEDNLRILSNFGTVKVFYSEPVWIHRNRRSHVTSDQVTFNHLFKSRGGTLCYSPRSNGRSGWPVSSLDKIVFYELKLKNAEFKDYEEFRMKFDPMFISEDKIKVLWDGKSGQHGGKYNKGDFRKLSRYGQQLMRRFLTNFKGIDAEPGEAYSVKEDHKSLSVTHYSTGSQNSNWGRDITISHQTNVPLVYYSSEYPGCGNGRYGLIANKNTYLWIEDD